jgi:MFS family permease
MASWLSRIGPRFRSDTNRRNFWLGVANGAIYHGGEAFVEPYVVLTFFVSLLTSSKFLIGLVAPIRVSTWFLPQLLVSGYIQRQPRKIRVYGLIGVIRVGAWILLAVLLWFVRDLTAILVVFFVLLTVSGIADGVAGLSFMDIVAKVIPVYRRGAFIAARLLGGGILGVGAGLVVSWVLSREANWVFPRQFALLFGAFAVLAAVGIHLFTRIDEPEERPESVPSGVVAQLNRAYRLPGQNQAFGRFLMARVLMVVADMAIPFYVVFARERLGAPAGLVGIYLSTLLVSGLLANLWAGRASDRFGNRHLLLRACVLGALGPVSALILGWMRVLPLAFVIVFVLQGLYSNAATVAHTSFVLDFAPAGDRPIYVGTANTLVGLGILLSASGGAIVDWAGFEVMFGVSIAALVLAGLLVLSIREPRFGNSLPLDASASGV